MKEVRFAFIKLEFDRRFPFIKLEFDSIDAPDDFAWGRVDRGATFKQMLIIDDEVYAVFLIGAEDVEDLE